ncbi:MAG: hypothetical protein GQ578_10360, partial [Desulfuromonadaceae bacterium]|nr:hypothetical protein [Desulfuromonadaceae bacterium]
MFGRESAGRGSHKHRSRAPRKSNFLSATSFGYDDAGNLTAWETDGDGSVSGTLTYDELNRKTGETLNYGGFSKDYSY